MISYLSTVAKCKRAILFLSILVGVITFSQAILGFWPWTKGIALWGEAFTSINYSDWLKTLSQAWGNQSALGTSHLYFPESQGQFAIFTASASTSAYYWLQAMTFMETIFRSLTQWFYLNFSFILPFFGMFYLAWVWTRKNIWLSTMAGFLLMTSPITLERLMAGVSPYVSSIGLFAWLIALYLQYGRRQLKRENNLILCGLFLTAGIFPAIIPHFLVIFTIWWFVDFIFPGIVKPELGKQQRSQKLVALGAVVFGALMLSFSIWWPAMIYEFPTRSISQSYFQLRALKIAPENFTYFKTLTLSLGGVENGLQIFKQYPYLLWARLVFLLIMVVGCLKINKRYGYLLLLLFILGTVLSVGDKPPFGFLFVILYQYFPGFSTFRDPSKFLILLVIPFILMSIDLLANVIARQKLAKYLAPISLSIALIISFATAPYIYLGKIHQIINPIIIPEEFKDLARWLDVKAAIDSRVFIWPDLTNIDSELPLKTPVRSFQKSVFTGLTHSQISVANPTGIYNFPTAEYLINLKKMISNGQWEEARLYYALDYIIENKKLSPAQPLANSSRLKKVFENKTFIVYQIPENNSGKLFVENNPVIVSTGQPVYKLFSSKISPLTLDGLLFKQSLPKQIPFLIYNQEKLAVLLDLVPEKYIVDPTEIVRHNIGESWQCFGGNNDTDFLEKELRGASKYSIYADFPAELKLKYNINQDSQIYIKAFAGDQIGNNLEYYLNNKKMSSVELSGNSWQEYRWLKVGEINRGKGEIEIKSLRRERAIIDKIIIVPRNTIDRIENQFLKFTSDRQRYLYYSPEYLLERSSKNKVYEAKQLVKLSARSLKLLDDKKANLSTAILSRRNETNTGATSINIDSKDVAKIELSMQTYFVNQDYPIIVEYQTNRSNRWQDWIKVIEDNPLAKYSLTIPDGLTSLTIRLTIPTTQSQGSAQIKKVMIKSFLKNINKESDLKDFQLIGTEDDISKFLPKTDRQYLSADNLNQIQIHPPQLIINQFSYNPNWRLGSIAPVHALGYAQGYLVTDRSQLGDLQYLPEQTYQIAIKITKTIWILALTVLVILGLTILVLRKNTSRRRIC